MLCAQLFYEFIVDFLKGEKSPQASHVLQNNHFALGKNLYFKKDFSQILRAFSDGICCN